MKITVACLLTCSLLLASDTTAREKPSFSDKFLLLEELPPGQIALAFPITWFFNETGLIEATGGSATVLPGRLRRRAGWGRAASMGVGAAVGAVSGAVYGSLSGAGSLAGGAVGTGAGIIAGAAAADAVGWRRKRSLPPSDSDASELPCKLLCQVFAATDRDQDGRLSPEELGLVPVPTAQFLGLLDLDGNTFVEPSEFGECLPSRIGHLCHDCGICEDLSEVDGLESFMEGGYYMPATGRIYV